MKISQKKGFYKGVCKTNYDDGNSLLIDNSLMLNLNFLSNLFVKLWKVRVYDVSSIYWTGILER